jgi:hypothetical protein
MNAALHEQSENPWGSQWEPKWSEWELEQEHSCCYLRRKTHTFQKQRSITDQTKVGSLTFCPGVTEDDLDRVACVAQWRCAQPRSLHGASGSHGVGTPPPQPPPTVETMEDKSDDVKSINDEGTEEEGSIPSKDTEVADEAGNVGMITFGPDKCRVALQQQAKGAAPYYAGTTPMSVDVHDTENQTIGALPASMVVHMTTERLFLTPSRTPTCQQKKGRHSAS